MADRSILVPDVRLETAKNKTNQQTCKNIQQKWQKTGLVICTANLRKYKEIKMPHKNKSKKELS